MSAAPRGAAPRLPGNLAGEDALGKKHSPRKQTQNINLPSFWSFLPVCKRAVYLHAKAPASHLKKKLSGPG